MSMTDSIEMTDLQKRTRRRRSIALALVLAGVVAVFYIATIVKFGPAILDRAF